MSKGKKIGGIILIIFGTIFLVIGIAVGGLFGVLNSSMDDAMEEVERQIEDARRTGVTTYGEITGIDSESMATIEFYCDEDGSWYYFNMMVVSDNYDVGSIVEVCYDPYRLGDSDYVPVAPAMMMEGMDVILSTASTGGTVVGVVLGIIGAVLLIIGIVMLVSNKNDKKWADEINARNAAMGIGGAQPGVFQQMPGGQPMGSYQQPGQPMNGYQQAPGGYQQPGQPVNVRQPVQPGETNGYTSNPYQQNNDQNM